MSIETNFFFFLTFYCIILRFLVLLQIITVLWKIKNRVEQKYAFCILLNRDKNFNNGLENGKSHTQFQRDELVLQLIQELQIKSKTVMSWKEKRGHFFPVYFVRRNIFKICVSSQCILNTLSEYTYFCITKNFTSYTFLLLFNLKSSKAFSVSLKLNWMRSLCEGYSLDVRVFHDRSSCSPKSA